MAVHHDVDVDDVVAFDLPDLEPVELVPRPADAGGRESPVERARVEADAIREAARAEGFAAGLAEGHAQLQATVAVLTEAVEGMAAARHALADCVERASVDLGLRIAEHALSGALHAEPERVVDVVRGALRCLVDRERVTILVHPEDLDRVRAAAPDLIAQLGGIEHCEVQAERRVTQGGALVRTVEGEIDATLETKLLRAREAVIDSLSGRQEPSQGDDEPS